MKKGALQQWLTERGIAWEEQWLRARLMQEVDRYRDKKPMVEILGHWFSLMGTFLPFEIITYAI
jgi:hypothetical protein